MSAQEIKADQKREKKTSENLKLEILHSQPTHKDEKKMPTFDDTLYSTSVMLLQNVANY